MALMFNFRKINCHGDIITNGTVFVRMIDEKLESTHKTVIGLIIIDSIVVDQFIIIKGDFYPPRFVGMNTVNLMKLSSDFDCLTLTNGKEEVIEELIYESTHDK